MRRHFDVPTIPDTIRASFKPRSIFLQSTTTLSSTLSGSSTSSTFPKFKFGVCERKASAVAPTGPAPRVLETLADVAEDAGIRYEQVVWARVDISADTGNVWHVTTTPILLSIVHYPEPEATGRGITWLTGNGSDVRYVPIARGVPQAQVLRPSEGPHDYLLPPETEKVVINIATADDLGSMMGLLRFNLPQNAVEVVLAIGDGIPADKVDSVKAMADNIYQSCGQLLHEGLTLRIVGSQSAGLVSALHERLATERQELFGGAPQMKATGQVPYLPSDAPGDEHEAKLRHAYLGRVDQCIVAHSSTVYAEIVGAEVYALEMGRA